MYERFYQLRHRPFALSPDPGFPVPQPCPSRGVGLPALRHRGPRRLHRHHRRDWVGKDHAAPGAAADARRGYDSHRLVNTLLTGRELIESMLLDLGVADPPPSKPGYAARAGTRAGRAASNRPARRGGHRRGSEPVARRAGRAPDAVQSRDGEVEADSGRPGRTARPSRLARTCPRSSNCASG